jgi:RNA polymerase sigma factor (sigma-70 family)
MMAARLCGVPSMSPDSQSPATSASLFRELWNPGNKERAWGTFLARYRPLIDRWCRRLGLQEADAQEVASEVLVKLARALPAFHYDPQKRFRGWLKTVVENAVRNWWRDTARRPGARGSGDSDVAGLLEQAAEDGEVDTLASEMDERLEADLAVARQAVEQVQPRVKEHTWRAFWLTAVEGKSGPEAAAELGLPVAHVYVAKKRVGALLREAAAALGRNVTSLGSDDGLQ